MSDSDKTVAKQHRMIELRTGAMISAGAFMAGMFFMAHNLNAALTTQVPATPASASAPAEVPSAGE